jgi:hypothetical protein
MSTRHDQELGISVSIMTRLDDCDLILGSLFTIVSRPAGWVYPASYCSVLRLLLCKYSGWGVMLTIHIHLVLQITKGVIPQQENRLTRCHSTIHLSLLHTIITYHSMRSQNS